MRREFVSEAEEILERMRGGLADLADTVDANQEADPEIVNGLFRWAHSLKGSAAMFECGGVRDLAHQLEEVLDGLRLGRLPLEDSTLRLLEDAVRVAAGLLARIEETGNDPDPPAALEQLIQRVQQVVRHEPPSGLPEMASLDLDPSILRALTEYEEHRLRESLRLGRCIHLVEVTFEILSFEQGLSELTGVVRAVGELISTLPAPGDTPEAQIRFALLVASELGSDELYQRLNLSTARVRTVGDPAAAPPGAPSPAREPDWERAVGPSPRTRDGAHGETSTLELESLRSISRSVRVDIHKLDELMNLVGELMIQRSAIGSLAARLVADPRTTRIGQELSKSHRGLERKLQELQAGVLDARMVPLRQVFDRLATIVRRMRREMGKAVRLEVRGADTELDKLLVEELIDPLMHVVRNAFDHAIESPEERCAAGKPEEGTIRIEAFQRGSHVIVQVSDDGRGIDSETVRARALQLGLIDARDVRSRREIMELIFAPGLSTRSRVTKTSGRGVGMDVVRENLMALGGLAYVDSEPGQGTTVSFTLPVTLAIVRALRVRVGGHHFAIPLTSVLETLPVEPDEVQRSQSQELLNLRGEPLRLRRLREVFGIPESGVGKQYAVVIGLGDERLGLLVDALEGQQDAVLKPIRGPIAAPPGVAGATEFEGEQVVLMVDVAALLEDSPGSQEAA